MTTVKKVLVGLDVTPFIESLRVVAEAFEAAAKAIEERQQVIEAGQPEETGGEE